MENYDRQQDGGNFGEVREDVFLGPSDGEGAVSEDAGQDDWGGGLLNWAIPQEEQQGFVEGGYDPGFIPEGESTPGREYDPGFVPEGEYIPGSEYDPGFIPEDKRNEVLAEDAPVADPWDVTPLLGMAGQEAGPGDAEMEHIEFTPEEAAAVPSQADAGHEEIEMSPEYVGQAGDAGQEQPSDAPVLLDAPPTEPVEQADAGEGEIEKPPEYVGRAVNDTTVDENDIEMLSDDAGQAGAADGETEEIESTPEEAAAIHSQPDAGDGEAEMTGDEETETTGSEDAELAARYDNVSDGNHPRFAFSSEEYLADYYRTLYKQLNGSYNEPNMAELDTYDKLRTGVYKLWEQRDNVFEQHERGMDTYYREWFKKEFGYDLGEEDWMVYSNYITGTKNLDEDVSTETTPGDAGQAGDDATVDENDIEMLPNDPGQAGADAADDGPIGIRGAFQKLKARRAGDEEIEMPPVVFGPADAGGGETEEIESTPEEAAAISAQADAGDGEIEMPPEYVGHVNIGRPRELSQDEAHEKDLADYGSYEKLTSHYKEIYNSLPDNYRIMGLRDDKFDPSTRENLDTYEELKAETKRLLDLRDKQAEVDARLEARYGDEISGDPGLQTYDQLADYYKNLHTVLLDAEPDMKGLDTHEKLKIATYEVMESRDRYLKQHGLLEEKVESDVDDAVEPPVIDSDKDPVGEVAGDPGETVDEYYGYGDYFGW